MIEQLLAEASRRMGGDREDIRWWAWPEVFANTSGPRMGAGGQTMTHFQVFGFESPDNGNRLKYCDGIWRSWDGRQMW